MTGYQLIIHYSKDIRQFLIENLPQQKTCSPMSCRVPHGYGNTRGVSKTGNAGTGTVLDFGTPRTPCTRTAVSRVFTG